MTKNITMTIYNILKDKKQKAHESKHDTTEIMWGTRAHIKSHDRQGQIIGTWAEIKQKILDEASSRKSGKDYQRTFNPHIINDDSKINPDKSQSEKYALGRHWICFDFDNGWFDSNGNPIDLQQWIELYIPNIVCIGWHSFSNGGIDDDGNIKRKGRVIIPLSRLVGVDEYNNQFMSKQIQWAKNNNIDDCGWLAGNTKTVYTQDASAYKLIQVQYMPSQSHYTHDACVIVNDGDNTSILDVDDVLALDVDPAIIAHCTAPASASKPRLKGSIAAMASSPAIRDYVASSGLGADAAAVLMTHPSLRHIPSTHFQSGQRLCRTHIAAAWLSMGFDVESFSALDAYMAEPTSTTPTARILELASAYEDKRPDILAQLLGKQWLIDNGLLSADCDLIDWKDILSKDKSQWDDEINLKSDEYYDIDKHWGTDDHHVILVCGGLGIGKNYTFAKVPIYTTETIYDSKPKPGYSNTRYVVLTSLRNIVKQSNSDRRDYLIGEHGWDLSDSPINNLDNDYYNTYTYDQSKNIINKIESGEWRVEDIVLVIDECHNLARAAYRSEALFYCHKLISDYGNAMKKIVYQSGTIMSDFVGDLPIDYRIKISKDNGIKHNYQVIEYDKSQNNRDIYLYSLAKELKESNDLVIILHNNTRQNQIMGIALQNAVCVDSGTSRMGNTYASQLISGDLDVKEVDYIIGTYSLVEGLSIQEPMDNVAIIAVGMHDPVYIMQVAGRCRKAKNVHIKHLYNFVEKQYDIDTHIKMRGININKQREYIKNMQSIDPSYTTLLHNHKMFGDSGIIYGIPFVDNEYHVLPVVADRFLESNYEMKMSYKTLQHCESIIEHYGCNINDSMIKSIPKTSVVELDNAKDKTKIALGVSRTRVRDLLDNMIEFGISFEVWGELGNWLTWIIRDMSEIELYPPVNAKENEIWMQVMSAIHADNGVHDIDYVIDRVFDENIKDSDIENENIVENISAKDIIESTLRAKYAGKLLIKEEQKELIKEIVNMEIDQYIKINPGKSRKDAYYSIAEMDIFANVCKHNGGIKWDKDLHDFVVEKSSPKILGSYLGSTSTELEYRTIDGKKVRVRGLLIG